MSSTDSQIQRLEQDIKESKKLVELHDALVRLKSNRDFQRVIQKGYFEEEAIRLVHAKAESGLQSADSQRSIITQMDAIGNLAQYFSLIAYKADLARKAIVYNTETLEEIAAGELE